MELSHSFYPYPEINSTLHSLLFSCEESSSRLYNVWYVCMYVCMHVLSSDLSNFLLKVNFYYLFICSLCIPHLEIFVAN